MKKYGSLIFTYGATALAMFLLYYFSGQQYGGEWLFSSFTVFIFSLFLLLWKMFSKSVIGVFLMTFYTVMNLNSILYLTPNEASTIYVTFLTGVLLVLYRKTSPEGIVASLGLVLINIAFHLPFSNFVLSAIGLGICAIIAAVCWLRAWRIAKWIYTALVVIMVLLTIVYAL